MVGSGFWYVAGYYSFRTIFYLHNFVQAGIYVHISKFALDSKVCRRSLQLYAFFGNFFTRGLGCFFTEKRKILLAFIGMGYTYFNGYSYASGFLPNPIFVPAFRIQSNFWRFMGSVVDFYTKLDTNYFMVCLVVL